MTLTSPSGDPQRVALVVGASRGIGAVTARAFARAGAAVVLAARDEQALAAVAAGIEAEGGRALALPTDVTDAAAAATLVERAVAAFGRLDHAFNNATDGTMPAPLADVPVDGFDRAIAANVRGTFLGMRAQIPAMLETTGGGAIVNMASVAGVQAIAGLGPYATGKAGIIMVSQVAALDYADQGVRVNVVAPGPILTHHLERAGAEAQRQAAASIPMGRIGSPQEVADAVLFLCSGRAAFITGAVLPIDGGQTAGVKPARMYRQGEPMPRASA
jgi:NAD(P)-dependent dehydrogenase (short-subunit alcohol dehydrogenase family)